MKIKNIFLVSVLCLFGCNAVSQNVFLGTNSYGSTTLPGSPPPSSKDVTAIGTNAGQFIDPTFYNTPPNNNIGRSNTYLGCNSGQGVATIANTGFSNTFLGYNSGKNVSSGSNNVFVGTSAGESFTTGADNVFIGKGAGNGFANMSSTANVFIGFLAGSTNGGTTSSQGTGNTYVGHLSGTGNTSSGASVGRQNSFFGGQSGQNNKTGSFNTFLGYFCGYNMISGIKNTFIGRVNLTNTSTSNTIVLADGELGFDNSGNQRLYIHSNGNAGFDIGNNNIPQNRLEINSAGAQANTLGLRFRNLPTASITNPTDKVLSVNAAGDVILVDDKQAIGGALTALCNTQNYVTKFSGLNNQITCSSIYDNGSSVGIGTTGPFGAFNPNTGVSETIKLEINGLARGISFYNSSDRKFKKDIKAIETPLDKIMALEGKTYNWRKDEFKDKNFGSELQYGLIAQEVQKILPSLVIESDKGDLAMNYIGLIPVLIEAMKEQQTQIDALKAQISNNFKTQNQDLLQFENTKIISVSPNPSSDVISVSLNVEKAVASAKLQVHDLNGILLSSLNVKERDTKYYKIVTKRQFWKRNLYCKPYH